MKLCIIVVCCLAIQAAMGAGWSYSNIDAWSHDYPVCGSGRAQSPIDITTKNVEFDTTLGDLQFSSNCGVFLSDKLSVTNDGHTLKVELTPHNSRMAGYNKCLMVDAVGDQYEFLQFHMHTPGENTFNAMYYPMVVHTVFRHTVDASRLAVIAVQITNDNAFEGSYGSAGSPLFQTIFSNAPTAKDVTNTVTYSSSTAMSFATTLFPYNFDGSYYTWPGSLTTPPCSEGVTWYALRQPLYLPRSTVQSFIDIFTALDSQFPDHNGNIRPIQPLYGRVVRTNKRLSPEGRLLSLEELRATSQSTIIKDQNEKVDGLLRGTVAVLAIILVVSIVMPLVVYALVLRKSEPEDEE